MRMFVTSAGFAYMVSGIDFFNSYSISFPLTMSGISRRPSICCTLEATKHASSRKAGPRYSIVSAGLLLACLSQSSASLEDVRRRDLVISSSLILFRYSSTDRRKFPCSTRCIKHSKSFRLLSFFACLRLNSGPNPFKISPTSLGKPATSVFWNRAWTSNHGQQPCSTTVPFQKFLDVGFHLN